MQNSNHVNAFFLHSVFLHRHCLHDRVQQVPRVSRSQHPPIRTAIALPNAQQLARPYTKGLKGSLEAFNGSGGVGAHVKHKRANRHEVFFGSDFNRTPPAVILPRQQER